MILTLEKLNNFRMEIMLLMPKTLNVFHPKNMTLMLETLNNFHSEIMLLMPKTLNVFSKYDFKNYHISHQHLQNKLTDYRNQLLFLSVIPKSLVLLDMLLKTPIHLNYL